jgi:murein L,D-transpeptidase YafK
MLIFLFLGSAFVPIQKESFKIAQLRLKRVKDAYQSHWPGLEASIREKNIDPGNIDLLIRVFKLEKTLELWIKNKKSLSYTLLKTIPICASSGELGPKRREGDRQVPEGLYEISVFNAYSDYFLAVKVNYPNPSDRIRATGPPGGDIMIHGNCVTIGCIPLQDEPVKDLYLLCVEARNRKCPIRVEIFPCKMNEEQFQKLKANYPEEKYKFWSEIRYAFTKFEENHQVASYTINKSGNYVFK